MKVALWARVSTSDQHAENQTAILREWAERRGDTVVRVFETEDSAWSQGGGTKGREFDKARAALIAGAHRAEYQGVLIWALDRLSRRGYRDLETLMAQLRESGCELLSHQEPFIRALGPWGEIVIHMLALVANHESERRSERIKAGMARVKREGRTVGGRVAGSKNKGPRPRLTGEAAGWDDARRAALADRNRQRANGGGDHD